MCTDVTSHNRIDDHPLAKREQSRSGKHANPDRASRVEVLTVCAPGCRRFRCLNW
jgi:hypothetical protein